MKLYSRTAEKKLAIAGEATRPISYAAIPVEYVVLRRDPGDSGTVYVGGPDGYPLGPGDSIRLDNVVLRDVDIYVPDGITANIYAVFKNKPMTKFEIARLAPRNGLMLEYLFIFMGRDTMKAIDTSGHGRHGKIVGISIEDGLRSLGKRNTYVKVEQFPGSIAVTVEFVVEYLQPKTPYFGGFEYAVFKNGPPWYGELSCTVEGDWRITCRRHLANGAEFSIVGWTSTSTNHIIFRCDNTTCDLFINGKIVSTEVMTKPYVTTSDLFIARHGGRVDLAFKLYYVRLWNRMLSNEECEVLYDLAKLMVNV